MQENSKLRPPDGIDELKALIVSGGIEIPTASKRILEIGLRAPDTIAFGSAASIAEASSVAPSTVFRTAKLLGFNSFREFRQLFRKLIISRSQSETAKASHSGSLSQVL